MQTETVLHVALKFHVDRTCFDGKCKNAADCSTLRAPPIDYKTLLADGCYYFIIIIYLP